MWLDPTNKNRFYVGQDGGASITYDNGKTWVFYDNLCLAQFYAVSADMRDPYYVYGGLQDNGTWGGPSMSREGAILTDFWFNIGGGDGFHTQNDPTDWRTAYCESQGGAAHAGQRRDPGDEEHPARLRPTSSTTRTIIRPQPAAKPGAKPAAKPAPPGQAAPGQKPAGQGRAGPGARGSHDGHGRPERAAPCASTGARRSSCPRTTRGRSTWAATTSSGPWTAATTG